MNERFLDRRDAGRRLAEALLPYANREDVLVLALPRGGVPVGYEVARALGAPLEVFLVRKLGAPDHEELAIGAIASGGTRVINDAVISALGITAEEVERVAATELLELERRERAYRGETAPPEIAGRTVIVVDDGLATGASMRAVVLALRALGPAKLVVAVPVGAAETCVDLRQEVDDVVCLLSPDPFQAVGLWFVDFEQTSDDEVRKLLDAAALKGDPSGASDPLGSTRQNSAGEPKDPVPAAEVEWVEAALEPVRVEVGDVQIAGDLAVPEGASGIVIFAHGSGSSRRSARNRFVAERLQSAGLGTLLLDLLTPEEAADDVRTARFRFDVDRLAVRLQAATEWVRSRYPGMEVGLFGASTGAAAALMAAAADPVAVGAIVSRGGRPDLAGDSLPEVLSPTLLLVGSDDLQVLSMNEEALARMTSAYAVLEVVEGATHLFEEPGTLEIVADRAAVWFVRHLGDR